jgi:hypothetical protein
MPEAKPVEQNVVPLEHPEDGLFETYANAIDADWTLTDVTLRFMQMVHAPKEEGATNANRELIILEKANITVPWWIAKIGVQMLTGLIQAYESVNGEIKKPELARLPEASKPAESEEQK